MSALPKHLQLNVDPPGSATLIPVQGENLKAWKNQKNGYTTFCIHFGADEEKNSHEWFSEETRQLKDDQIKREYLLDFASRAGQRAFPYLEYTPDRWFIKPIHIPKNWTIIAGLDFGSRNPTSIHLYAIDHRGRFTAFWEFYKPSTPSEIARVLKNHPLWDRVLKVVADPSIFNKNQHVTDTSELGKIKSIAEILEELGIYNLERGVNDRLAGLARVKHMLRYSDFNKDLEPYLKITTDCPMMWKELLGLTHREQTASQLLEKNIEEDVVKKGDHSFDELKYSLMSWKVASEGMEKPPTPVGSFKELEEEIDDRYRFEEGDEFTFQ